MLLPLAAALEFVRKRFAGLRFVHVEAKGAGQSPLWLYTTAFEFSERVLLRPLSSFT